MKKLFSLFIAVVMLLGCASLPVSAEDASLSATVYVSVANKGSLVISSEKVTVTDIDGDNVLTVNDALYAVHEEKYEGGAAAGYSYYSYEDYGLSLGMLWGDNSGNFGYCLNNAFAWSLADPVSDGDYVYAYIYTDTDYYSDMYTFFDANSVSVAADGEISLTLSGAGYDEAWNPVTVPVAEAAITVNGEKIGIKTDENGKATVRIADGGTYVISAISESAVLVPPVCIATVSAPATEEPTEKPSEEPAGETSPDTGDSSDMMLCALFILVSIAVIVLVTFKKRNSHEK